MTVLYILTQFPTYSETFVFDEIRGHLEHGAEVEIVVLGDTGASDFPVGDYGDQVSNRTTYLGLEPATKLRRRMKILSAGIASVVGLRTVVEAWRLWRREQLSACEVLIGAVIASKFRNVEIVHCHFGHIGRLGLAVKRQMPVDPALVVTFHAFELVKPWSQPLDRFYGPIFRSDARLLPICGSWRTRLISAGASRQRTFVHHMGVDIPEGGCVRPRNTQGTTRLVMVGRMVEKKGHRTAIEALGKLRDRRPDIRFRCDMIGSGPLFEAVSASVREQGLEDVVRLHGSKPHAETLRTIEAADVLLLPSMIAADGDMEGIPIVLMEAMARGVPVISTRHSGIPELVEDSRSGLLTPEGDSTSLAEAITRVLTDADLRQRLSAGARAKAAKDFNRARQFVRLLDHYRSLRLKIAH
jgi:colanic acid/amylovoran biosynthesis glycosyltransferase